MNADLCRAFPHRSMDSIKGFRKSINYKFLVTRLEVEDSERPPSEAPESPVRVEHDDGVARKWTTPEPMDRRGPKVRWSEDLLYDVTRWEARLPLVGCPDINVQLSGLFSGRILEAIKGMRRLPKFRSIADSMLESEGFQGTLPGTDRSPPEPGSRRSGEMPE